MKQTIELLSEELINQIAAGEVIESPASVVKELVENSLDAKSPTVHVEIQGGGFHLIRVVDQGIGMNDREARLSILRHATSKIRKIEDLETILTLGFRGEGLSSVAAISRLRMQTKQKHESVGREIVVEAGEVVLQEPNAFKEGTSIDVTSLFFNVPARRKFQKAPHFAALDVARQMGRFALGHYEKGFTLISQGKQLLHFLPKSGDPKELVGQRVDFCDLENLEWITYTTENFSLYGYISKPSFSLKNRAHQYLFVHRRFVINQGFAAAVKNGYSTLIDQGRFPAFVLYLEPKNGSFDVNVHPQKLHVRFEEEALLYKQVSDLLFTHFSRGSLMPQEKADWILPPSPYLIRDEKISPQIEPFSEQLTLPIPASFKPLLRSGSYLLFTCPQGVFYLANLSLLLPAFPSVALQDMQQLAFPKTIKLPIDITAEDLQKWGILARPFGQNYCIVEAHAPWLNTEKIEEMIPLFMEAKEKSWQKVTCSVTQQEALALVVQTFYLPEYKRAFVMLNEKVLARCFT